MQAWLLGIWEDELRTVIFITHDIKEAVFLSDRILTMSARPGRIKGEVAIDLPRPRDHMIVTMPRFTALKRAVLDYDVTMGHWKKADGAIFVQEESVWQQAQDWAMAQGLIIVPS